MDGRAGMSVTTITSREFNQDVGRAKKAAGASGSCRSISPSPAPARGCTSPIVNLNATL
jgi:hypothetical protein